MSLSDIVSRLGLGTFPTIALVIFLVVFVAVMTRAFSKRRTKRYEHLAELPLEDDESPNASNGSNDRNRA